MKWVDDLKFDSRGLVPVIAQDAHTGEVLMLAYANKEAIEKTIATRTAWYWSRERQRLWKKGETSGNVQNVVEVRYDCDMDAVLYRVLQTGNACHEGHRSCFYRGHSVSEGCPTAAGSTGPGSIDAESDHESFLQELYSVILDRKQHRPKGSYVAGLMNQGDDEVFRKVGEEAVEVILAAKNKDEESIVYETADLWFHSIVLLGYLGIPVSRVIDELRRRRK